MRMLWRVFVALSLWSVVSGPLTKADASYVYDDPMVNQVEHKRNERLSEPITKAEQANQNITIVGNDFMVDGKRLQIISGSLHYFRVPALYWRDRLKKMKAAGLNSVATYVEWSYHEPEERQYSFEGDRDIAQFIRIAVEEGLYVLLRLGPYICAERDLGGFPYWLLGKYPQIRLRTTDKDFMTESEIWLDKIFEQVSSLLYGNGGPIILVQVENEYGSYSDDMAYRTQLRDMIHKHVGSNALLYTTDGDSFGLITNGAVPNTLPTIDFNAFSDVNASFSELRRFMPEGPLMNSEFYAGWLTHWGESFSTIDAEPVVNTLGAIIDYGASVNFFMFLGGTNFEYTAGANYGDTYTPVITSYDYDAPLSEAGDPTPKYFMIRDKLKKYNFVDESIPVPTASQKGAYGPVNVTATVNLLSPEGRTHLGKTYGEYTGATLPTFEYLRQRAGLMLYETTLNEADGLLVINQPRDMIFIYVDGVRKGLISRTDKFFSLPLTVKNGSVLSLLVEPQGHIGYGSFIHDYKGILGEVDFNSKVLNGTWKVTGFPLETLDTSSARSQNNAMRPTFYEGSFTLPAGEAPLDTFVDTTGWGKGYVWVNGHNLGRYWPSVGPQITLYLPGIWLKPAPNNNHIQILELDKPAQGYVWVNGHNLGRYWPSVGPQITLYLPGIWLKPAPNNNHIQILELDKPAQVASMDFIDHPILNRTGHRYQQMET